MAHKKGGGSVSGGRDSKPKMRGIKRYGGQQVKKGEIIVRQKGTKYHQGENVRLGKDFTIFALKEGKVSFRKLYGKQYIDVV